MLHSGKRGSAVHTRLPQLEGVHAHLDGPKASHFLFERAGAIFQTRDLARRAWRLFAIPMADGLELAAINRHGRLGKLTKQNLSGQLLRRPIKTTRTARAV
jgi:hypothetical protein